MTKVPREATKSPQAAPETTLAGAGEESINPKLTIVFPSPIHGGKIIKHTA